MPDSCPRFFAPASGPSTLLLCVALLGCSQKPPTPSPEESADLAPTRDTAPAADLAPAACREPGQQCNHLLLHRRVAEFATWTRSGVAVTAQGDGAVVRLAASKDRPLPCATADIDGGAAEYDPLTGLCAGQDPLPKGGYVDGGSYYNGGRFVYGTMVSPIVTPTAPIDHSGASRFAIDHLIASWNASTPAGTWIEVHVRARLGERWTRWYSLGVWASDFATIRRHSVAGQTDADGTVDTDTLALKGEAAGYQLGLTLFAATADVSPEVRLVAAVSSRDGKTFASAPADNKVWGTDLMVPQRSQELPEYKGQGYGGGGEVWCSPTSTSMVMAYWGGVLGRPGLVQTVPAAAAGCYDAIYKGTGNWPFNTSYAGDGELQGLILRLDSMSQAEAWIKAGVPLVISIAFKAGELPGAPISKTNGHLIVVRGFDGQGDVIVNDPAAANNERVRLVYPRAALEAAWSHSQRTAYAIFPRGRAVPLLVETP